METRRHLIYLYHRSKRKTAVELHYGYSRAGNGYRREIHRNSDMRRYVLLLYLNRLEEGAKGGDLRVYELLNPGQLFPSQPPEEDCTLVQSYTPEEGRLVVFRNTPDSYHSVAEMVGHSSDRSFICGDFTQLGGTNPNMRLSQDRLPTEFWQYT